MSSQDFVYQKFSDFYNNPSTEILPPILLDQREFGFLLLKERIMIRHKGFRSAGSFRTFLNETVPSDVYHSCAYYENPTFEMDKKGWLGADLVFDIDADHIPTSCNKIHDEWTCKKCGFSGKGVTPENCPICGSQKFDTKTWPCKLCLDSAKEETRKVIDMLEKDFGFSDKEIHVFFSGHRGYHIHVEKDTIKTLDAIARKEIVDYVSGIGLAMFDREQKEGRRSTRTPPAFAFSNFSWDKRIKKGMQKFIGNATKDDLRNIGVKQTCDLILKNKEMILKRCLEENRWTSVTGISTETWTRIAEYVKNLESAKIDTVVTTDIHRLIRSTGTLHGKTGLKKVECSASDLNEFDPFKEAVAFKEGTAKVFVSDAPEFNLGECVFGPYKNQKIELPVAAAILLICRGRAEVLR